MNPQSSTPPLDAALASKFARLAARTPDTRIPEQARPRDGKRRPTRKAARPSIHLLRAASTGTRAFTDMV